MKELISILINDKGNKTVSAKELHEFLEIKKYFTQWIKPYIKSDNDYGFIENVDFARIDVEVNPTNGIPLIDYELTIEMSKELSMLSKSEKGKEARKYFIGCEKELKVIESQIILTKFDDFGKSIDDAKKQFKPSHRTKLKYNTLIKKLAYDKEEFEAIKTYVFAMLGIDKWEDTCIEDSKRIMELITNSATLISSKPFRQTKLY